MSDPRFARLKADPRFRRPKKQQSKVVVDERFKEVFEDGKAGTKKGKKGRVDKYGRKVSNTHESDNLRRFYRLENEEEGEVGGVGAPSAPDYARGGILMESSDEEEDRQASGDDSDFEGIVTLGADPSKPSSLDDDDADIDLDEDVLADLDAQAAAYAEVVPSQDNDADDISRTRRLGVVNLDWDHVRATHLFKIFSSLVSPTAPISTAPSSSHIHPDRKKAIKTSPTTVARGKVLSVRIYPSEFGKERMAREEREGPPAEVFKKTKPLNEDDVNEKTIYETGDGDDYDEDALRKYQLERLRYYYAIVECDTVAAASHIYSELEGTELERSANVFDLSFVPDDMAFDTEYRDEATSESSMPYKAVEFVTDALRHSKVKLTWDEDDPERTQITRRNLTRQEIEEADFRAYIASSSSGSESESAAPTKETRKVKGKEKKAERDKLRALLLDSDDGELPEGWGREEDEPGDMDMEIMFTPGLSDTKSKDQDETTLEKYQRKMKDKRKKRKEEKKSDKEEKRETGTRKKGVADDNFFDAGSEDDEGTWGDKKKQEKTPPLESTAEELALLVASDKPGGETAHFDMKSVLKSEKKKGKGKKKGKKDEEDDQEIQADFAIDVKDDRFQAVHEDHQFAIDPSNPHFKKTKSMAALIGERLKRQKDRRGEGGVERERSSKEATGQSLKSLVESVKRKSASYDQGGVGKRRKL
ncbi:hypothetical protein SERLADRAFT_418227 [Serpula lacrymans var. lacrymans S7.9]|uniref:Uncharacterized protein n=1 Tax=Serpula lacrymans var. lacrymans (strain S7.9) TaxID=578457 RepID=F8PA04_SERL9|nr:uncharacterized protein SERLADRAFT_418227 [Serpula lacrymans var. lacrymans S7.9]EGO20002.1 hypothetical protein SERLADRAFT_418227 [Serpula lacrymans var. lacrymans S7.9]